MHSLNLRILDIHSLPAPSHHGQIQPVNITHNYIGRRWRPISLRGIRKLIIIRFTILLVYYVIIIKQEPPIKVTETGHQNQSPLVDLQSYLFGLPSHRHSRAVARQQCNCCVTGRQFERKHLVKQRKERRVAVPFEVRSDLVGRGRK